jgi:hypothetical protein
MQASIIFEKEFPYFFEYDVGFEVLTAVVNESSIFWDVTPYVLLKVNNCFGGTYSFHLQDRRKNQERN